jgi:hypothetical protein
VYHVGSPRSAVLQPQRVRDPGSPRWRWPSGLELGGNQPGAGGSGNLQSGSIAPTPQEQNKSTRTCRRPAPSALTNRGAGRGRARQARSPNPSPRGAPRQSQEPAQPGSRSLVPAARSLLSAAAPGAWPV